MVDDSLLFFYGVILQAAFYPCVRGPLARKVQFRLRWDQIDMEAGILTIPLPKGGKTRHVPIERWRANDPAIPRFVCRVSVGLSEPRRRPGTRRASLTTSIHQRSVRQESKELVGIRSGISPQVAGSWLGLISWRSRRSWDIGTLSPPCDTRICHRGICEKRSTEEA
jgi:hypothetical protein